MDLRDILSPERVHDAVQATDKPGFLRQLAREAANDVQVGESELVAALVSRESLGSTGIGQGIAIPHARISGLKQIYCAFYKLAKPIEFGAVDDIPVDVVVLLLIPQSDERSGIQALSCVARRLKSQGLLEKIRGPRRSDPLNEVIFL